MFKFRVRPLFFFLISVLFIGLASKYNGATELIYTNVINKFIREKLSNLSSYIPFPIGDVLTFIFIALIIYCLVTLVRRLKMTSNVFEFLYKLFWGIVNVSSILFFVYIIVFGLNYHTPPVSKILIDKYNSKYATNIKVDIDNAKRVEVYNFLVEKAKETRKLAMYSEIKYSTNNLNLVSEKANEGYRMISDIFPKLSGNYGNAKLSIKSPIFNFFGLDGRHYYLTNEISLNKKIPSNYLPFIVSKYMAYQRGIAKEDEACFYAYLACINNTDPKFKYSGYLSALDYVVSTLRTNDKIDYNNLIVNLDPEIRRDLNVIEAYKSQYGFGSNLKDQFMYKFKRLNGDIRVEDINTQVTDLIATYYSLFTY